MFKSKIEYNVQDDRCESNIIPLYKLNDDITLREYQKCAVIRALHNRFCCIQLPTSTGKTKIFSCAIIKSFLIKFNAKNNLKIAKSQKLFF